MKKLAGIGLIILGCIILMNVLSSFFSFSNKGNKEDEVVKEVQTLTNINIKSVTDDLDIEMYEGDELIVRLENNNNNIKLITKEQGNGFDVEIKKHSFHLFNFKFWENRTLVKVLIPENYGHELNVKTVSGQISMDGQFALSNLKGKTISGNINIAELKTSNVGISTTSGNIEFGQLIADKVSMNSVSGNLIVETMTGEVEGKTVSGDVNIGFERENESVALQTTSGDVNIRLPTGNADLNVKTQSGDIEIESNLSEQNIQSRAISGKIGNGTYPVSVKTTSGDVYIR